MALEAELESVRRRVTMPRLTEEQVNRRIQEYRDLVKEISGSLRVSKDPDSYIAKLRAKEYQDAACFRYKCPSLRFCNA